MADTFDASVDATETSVPPPARLILLRGGAETEHSYALVPPATIGRFDPEVGPIDVDLGALQPEGGYISRRHAKVNFENGEWTISDLGSSNGTWVLRGEFEKVETTILTDGDQIALGNARFVFRVGVLEPASEEAVVEDTGYEPPDSNVE